ncbi:Dot/Icm type IV secretion system effector CoxH3 [Pseudonocardia ailaonensis]|uniref:Dot/Icm type IV secretion system effector CoxH3 n=1 Tax=Pseudonocardia ailaonensis TaxID=367279 RepID=A0ABN2MM40_9PSEU
MQVISADGTALDAELALPEEPRGGLVFCHPHPHHGGSMHTPVVEALFEGLPAHGIAVLRFDFRGVGRSGGTHTGGDREREDAAAAVAALAEALGGAQALAGSTGGGLPILLGGWSFGADVALSTAPEGIAGWFAVAPPLRFALSPHGTDPRAKVLMAGERDRVAPPDHVREATAGWAATTVETVPGADHLFLPQRGLLVERAAQMLTRSGCV